mmetsp:Transcript_28984/g.83127  ORF Transcript_28984/g.83127 Transcript_28984/m.83127 type:complete len:434 (+) Transcript_28984:1557-2858(+)
MPVYQNGELLQLLQFHCVRGCQACPVPRTICLEVVHCGLGLQDAERHRVGVAYGFQEVVSLIEDQDVALGLDSKLPSCLAVDQGSVWHKQHICLARCLTASVVRASASDGCPAATSHGLHVHQLRQASIGHDMRRFLQRATSDLLTLLRRLLAEVVEVHGTAPRASTHGVVDTQVCPGAEGDYRELLWNAVVRDALDLVQDLRELRVGAAAEDHLQLAVVSRLFRSHLVLLLRLEGVLELRQRRRCLQRELRLPGRQRRPAMVHTPRLLALPDRAPVGNHGGALKALPTRLPAIPTPLKLRLGDRGRDTAAVLQCPILDHAVILGRRRVGLGKYRLLSTTQPCECRAQQGQRLPGARGALQDRDAASIKRPVDLAHEPELHRVWRMRKSERVLLPWCASALRHATCGLRTRLVHDIWRHAGSPQRNCGTCRCR